MLEFIPLRNKQGKLFWVHVSEFQPWRIKDPKTLRHILDLYFSSIAVDKLGRSMLTSDGYAFLKETLPSYLWNEIKRKRYKNTIEIFREASHYPKAINQVANAMGDVSYLSDFAIRKDYIFAEGGMRRLYKAGIRIPFEPLSPKWMVSSQVSRVPVVFGPRIVGKDISGQHLQKIYHNLLVESGQKAFIVRPGPSSFITYAKLGANYPTKGSRKSLVKEMQRLIPYIRKSGQERETDMLMRVLERWSEGVNNLQKLYKDTLELVKKKEIPVSLFQRFWYRMSAFERELKLEITPAVKRMLKEGTVSFSVKRWLRAPSSTRFQ